MSTFQLLNAKINNKQYISEYTYKHRYLYVCIWSRSLRKAVRAFTYSQWVMEMWFTTRGLRRRLSILTSLLFVALACLAFVEQGRNAHLADLVFPAFTAFRSAHTCQYHMQCGQVRNKESANIVNRFEGLGIPFALQLIEWLRWSGN